MSRTASRLVLRCTLVMAAVGAIGAVTAGCAGPPFAAPIDDLPVCGDFTSAKSRMEGSLKLPVRLRVLDGKNVLYKTIISGLRTGNDPKPRSFIADDNAKYQVEWAQCSNPRAPRLVTETHVSAKGRDHQHEDEGTSYDCGEAKVYKADGVLETKKGDRASHVIHFVAPPDPSCWTDDAPVPVTPPPAAPDAGAQAVEPLPPAHDVDASAPAPATSGATAPTASAAPRAPTTGSAHP